MNSLDLADYLDQYVFDPISPSLHRVSVNMWLDAQIHSLGEQVPQTGETIALVLENNALAVLGLMLLMKMKANTLILTPGAPEVEHHRLMKVAGCTRRLLLNNQTQTASLVGEPSLGKDYGGVLLTTSGSTGEPRLIYRSAASLYAEALRYKQMLSLTSNHRLLVVAPIAHAYAFGWVAAAILSGARLLLIPPTHFAAAVRMMASGVDWVVLTPVLARLMVRRPLPEDVDLPFPKLNVMVGAGIVDEALDHAFQERFGVRLSRNYGSTESGAVFAGLPPLPPRCVGFAMPDVQYRIVDEEEKECATDEIGTLHIRTECRWRSMGDLVSIGSNGCLTIHGRRSKSVRRGDQWISTSEVEQIVIAELGVRAVQAYGEPGIQLNEDHLILDVWPYDLAAFDPQQLMEALYLQLSPAKLPDELRIRASLELSQTGKTLSPPVFRLTSVDCLIEAAKAYKRAELVFAFYKSGVLEVLDGIRQTHEIAEALDLDLSALELALEQAERFGLVHRTVEDSISLDEMTKGIIEFEESLSIGWGSRWRILSILRDGLRRRSFDDEGISVFRTLYQRAMHGKIVRFRVLLGLHLARICSDMHIMEITAGPGDYLSVILDRWPTCTGRLWQISDLRSSMNEILQPHVMNGRVNYGHPLTMESFDFCFVLNAVHWSPLSQMLPLIWNNIRPGGCLLIDDLFLENDAISAEFGLDWLTHGGIAYRTLSDLVETLQLFGATVTVTSVTGSKNVKLVCARKPDVDNHSLIDLREGHEK